MEPILLVLIAVALMVGISASILYYLEKTKSDRIRNVKKSKGMNSEDDAYNKVKNAQNIAKILKRKGYKTEEASKMLENAELQIKRENYVKAKNLAREAKNKLEQNKMNPTNKSENKKDENEKDLKKKEAYSIDELKDMDLDEKEKMSERAKKMKKQQERLQSLPENYLESKFELDIIREKIDGAKENEDAQNYLKLAERYFDEGSYTEALKYSVKCKKAIDGKESGLLAGQKIDKKEKGEEKEKIKKEKPELTEIEEKSQQSEKDKKTTEGRKQVLKCPSCGYTGGLGDKFCSKCGTELEEISLCPNCDSEVREDDNYCPQCGTEL
ncbi:MAG: zinc-ribbon domain-containing protein [Thermoplasmatota archaeon]